MKRRLKIVRLYRARRRTPVRWARACERAAACHAAERFGVSTRSVRRFAAAYRGGGKHALMPSYQVLVCFPACSLSGEVVGVVLALRALLGWCGQRIAAELAQRGIARTTHTTIYRLLRRYRVPVRTYHPVGKRAGIRYRRQRVKAPNWTWHVDFAGPWEDRDGTKRSLLVVVDSYSRMLLALEVVPAQSSEQVEAVLARLFARYGTPRVVITDNGRAFAPSQPEWAHRFGAFLAGHGVEHRRTRAYYPQTNGKAEAMVKTVKRELMAHLARQWRWRHVEAACEAFRGWYNFYRAHGALGYEVPSSRYAGIRLPKRGLEALFGAEHALPEARVEVAQLPEITQSNRLNRLSLAVAA